MLWWKTSPSSLHQFADWKTQFIRIPFLLHWLECVEKLAKKLYQYYMGPIPLKSTIATLTFPLSSITSHTRLTTQLSMSQKMGVNHQFCFNHGAFHHRNLLACNGVVESGILLQLCNRNVVKVASLGEMEDLCTCHIETRASQPFTYYRPLAYAAAWEGSRELFPAKDVNGDSKTRTESCKCGISRKTTV